MNSGMIRSRLFAIPTYELKVGAAYTLFSHAMRGIDCVAVVDDGALSEEGYSELIEYYESILDVGGYEFIMSAPKGGYVPPRWYCAKDYHFTKAMSSVTRNVGVARYLSEANIWMLVTSIFGGCDFIVLPGNMSEHILDEMVCEWAFIGGYEERLIKQLSCAQKRIDFAVLPFIESTKSHEECIVLWGGNKVVLKRLKDACKRAGVNARDTLDF